MAVIARQNQIPDQPKQYPDQGEENQDHISKFGVKTLESSVHLKQSCLDGWFNEKFCKNPSFSIDKTNNFPHFKANQSSSKIGKQTNMNQFFLAKQRKPSSKWMSELVREFEMIEDLEDEGSKAETIGGEITEKEEKMDNADMLHGELLCDSSVLEGQKINASLEHEELWSSDDEMLLCDPSLVEAEKFNQGQANTNAIKSSDEHEQILNAAALNESDTYDAMDSDEDKILLEASKMFDPPAGNN